MLFFLPPAVQAAIGVLGLVIGLALGSYVMVGLGVVGIAVGAARYVRARGPSSI